MANDYNFQIKGLDKFIISLNEMDDNFNRDLENLIKKYGVFLFVNTKKNTPVDTGQLRRSWRLKYRKGDLCIRLYNNEEYGLYVEYGHRTRQGKGHSNPSKHYKYNPKPGGIKYVEGVYMLKTNFERMEKKFEEDLEKLLGKYGFK